MSSRIFTVSQGNIVHLMRKHWFSKKERAQRAMKIHIKVIWSHKRSWTSQLSIVASSWMYRPICLPWDGLQKMNWLYHGIGATSTYWRCKDNWKYISTYHECERSEKQGIDGKNHHRYNCHLWSYCKKYEGEQSKRKIMHTNRKIAEPSLNLYFYECE